MIKTIVVVVVVVVVIIIINRIKEELGKIKQEKKSQR